MVLNSLLLFAVQYRLWHECVQRESDCQNVTVMHIVQSVVVTINYAF